ncbi:hypothetical protein GFY24_22710 [Nocardia sp. SYP-A9097]|nr:hypothetical protein [Nocardia sp. SYP-A9097]
MPVVSAHFGGDSGPAHAATWGEYVHGIGPAVVRAASALALSDPDRKLMLAFLDVWAETVFAERTARLWVVTGEHKEGVRADAARTRVPIGHVRRAWRFVECRRAMGGPAEVHATAVEFVWGDTAQLREFTRLVRERGPLQWNSEAPRVLAANSTLSQAAAAILLSGCIDRLRYVEVLTTQQRKALDIGVAELEDAADELRDHLGDEFGATAALFTRGLPADPARLWEPDGMCVLADALPEDPADLWQPGGLRRMAHRVADAWIERLGCRPIVPETTRAAMAAVQSDFGSGYCGTSAADLCAILAAPQTAQVLLDDGHGFVDCWTTIVDACRWAYSHLPEGDPVRAGVAPTLGRLRARLRDPGLVLKMRLVREPDIQALSQLTGVTVTESSQGRRRYDDGLVIASYWGDDKGYWDLEFRPASYDFTAHSDLLRSVAGGYRDELPYLDWLFDPDCDRILARLAAADLPPGGFETDPTLTAADLVAEVADKLGLNTDAAALYLQLLTLKDPTDRNIRRWNGWKTLRHTAAQNLLLTRKLAIQDPRKSAGRTAFIPSRWVGKPGVELWKLPLHNLTLGWRDRIDDLRVAVPRRAIPDLYRTAWDRVVTGDAPS